MSALSNKLPIGVPYQASSRTLSVASGTAFLLAVLILVLFVLPAERGIDLTGAGSTLGLTQMSGAKARTEAPAAAAAASMPAIQAPTKQSIVQSTPWRSDEMTVVVKPHTGIEVKAMMKTGDHLIFRWESTAPVKMDMHGERPDAGDEFTRYWMESDLSSGQGAFTAPFEGRHGWFWRNRSDKDVTIKVQTAGFYGSLFQPK
jgi:hypothetical protein